MKRNQMIRLLEYPLTDAGNAARLHELFGKKWVYMPKFRKWMQWDGHCLQTVKAETLCLVAAVNWLLRSRVPFHTRSAVKELKKLHMAE